MEKRGEWKRGENEKEGRMKKRGEWKREESGQEGRANARGQKGNWVEREEGTRRSTSGNKRGEGMRGEII